MSVPNELMKARAAADGLLTTSPLEIVLLAGLLSASDAAAAEDDPLLGLCLIRLLHIIDWQWGGDLIASIIL